ncbi:hypothetical protein B566_EDAN016637 [Ephemera danica]|nr:hypothetical protein B566_EDAN016637 [Ephemera danica]
MALLLFDKIRKNELRSVLDESNQDIQIMLRKRQIQFLCEVGGPLSPGSEIYHAVKKTLESNAKELPPRGELIPLFDHLHSEVPSLRQLSRTVLRSSLKKTDTKGLDVSSLRVLCQDEMIPLPPDIVDLINFKKSSVSEMEVVEEMIEFL